VPVRISDKLARAGLGVIFDPIEAAPALGAGGPHRTEHQREALDAAHGGLVRRNLVARLHVVDDADAELKPVKIEGTMAFMVETCWPYCPTRFALERAQPDYDQAWAGFPKAKLP